MAKWALLVFAAVLAAPCAIAQGDRAAAIADAQKRFRVAVQQSALSRGYSPVTFSPHADPCTTSYLYITDWATIRSVVFHASEPSHPSNPQNYVHVTSDSGGVGRIPASLDQVGPMLQAGQDLMALCKGKSAAPASNAQGAAAGSVEVAPCPRDHAALARLLAGRRVISSRKEVPAVQASGIWLFGEAGENRYDPAGLTVLGVRPAGVEAPISGGKPFALDVQLPGTDTRRYDAAFRAAFPVKGTTCDKNGCSWQSRPDTWNAAQGTLIEARTSLSILDEEHTMFRCTYR